MVAGIVSAGVVCLLAGSPSLALAQDDARTGVSHPPDPATITTNEPDPGVPDETPATPAAKPSADVPAAPAETVYGPYVPYHAPGTPDAGVTPLSPAAYDPDANIVTEGSAGRDERMLESAAQSAEAKGDIDAGIVTRVPSRPCEISDGTLVKARLREDLSTLTTLPGTKFSAEVSEPVMQDGKVIVPVGSLLEGRVTWVRGGKRIGGAAAIHLEPRTITLPDGTQYVLRARVIDTDSWDATKVDDEGTILRKDNAGKTVAAMGLATGGGIAAGAMIGGAPGALIGAGVGAGASTVVWLKQDRQAELPKDLGIVFSLTEPMDITPAHAAVAPVKEGMPGGE